MTAVCLLRACLYSPRSCETEGDQFFPCPNTLILGCLLSNQTYVLAPVGVLFFFFGPTHCHLCSVCFVCLFRDPQRIPDSLGAARVSSHIHQGRWELFPQLSTKISFNTHRCFPKVTDRIMMKEYYIANKSPANNPTEKSANLNPNPQKNLTFLPGLKLKEKYWSFKALNGLGHSFITLFFFPEHGYYQQPIYWKSKENRGFSYVQRL